MGLGRTKSIYCWDSGAWRSLVSEDEWKRMLLSWSVGSLKIHVWIENALFQIQEAHVRLLKNQEMYRRVEETTLSLGQQLLGADYRPQMAIPLVRSKRKVEVTGKHQVVSAEIVRFVLFSFVKIGLWNINSEFFLEKSHKKNFCTGHFYWPFLIRKYFWQKIAQEHCLLPKCSQIYSSMCSLLCFI